MSFNQFLAIVLLLGNVFGCALYSQCAFDDAVQLSKLSKDDSLYINILEKYCTLNMGISDVTLHYQTDNPYYVTFVQNHTEPIKASSHLPKPTSEHYSTKNFAPIPKLIDGYAQFIAYRTKQELSIAFFQQMQAQIVEHQALNFIFPETAKTLAQIGEEIYLYQNYFSALTLSFDMDLEQLPINLINYWKTHTKKESTAASAIFLDLLRSTIDISASFEVIMLTQNIKKYNDLSLTNLDNDKAIFNVRSSLYLLAFLYEAFSDGNGKLLSIDEIKSVFDFRNRAELANAFWTLVWEKMPEDKGIYTTKSFISYKSILEDIAQNKKSVEILSYANSQQEKLSDIQFSLLEESTDRAITKNLFLQWQKAFAIIHKLGELLPPPLREQLDQKYLPFIDACNQAIISIERRQFTKAILDFLPVVRKIESLNLVAFEKKYLKYGNFMAGIAEAKTGAEVAEIIDNFALPVGSSVIKKKSKFNIALNGYMGVNFGKEFAKSSFSDHSFGNKWATGISAPLGLAMSSKLGKGAVTAFLQFVDVGAVSTFRFNDSKTALLPDISFSNIVAPGIHLSYAPAKYPIAIGIGMQHGPNLRSITAVSTDIDYAVAWRFLSQIAVDIPISNFYNSQ